MQTIKIFNESASKFFISDFLCKARRCNAEQETIERYNKISAHKPRCIAKAAFSDYIEKLASADELLSRLRNMTFNVIVVKKDIYFPYKIIAYGPIDRIKYYAEIENAEKLTILGFTLRKASNIRFINQREYFKEKLIERNKLH